jgi:hypothetical protein
LEAPVTRAFLPVSEKRSTKFGTDLPPQKAIATSALASVPPFRSACVLLEPFFLADARGDLSSPAHEGAWSLLDP